MGDWVTYKIQSVNPSVSLAEKLIEKKVAKIELTEEAYPYIQIDGTKLSPESFQKVKDYWHKDGIISVRKDLDGSLFYFHKWTYNDTPCTVISELLPEEVILIDRNFEWYESTQWYMKAKQPCNKLGVPVFQGKNGPCGIFGLSPKVVKENKNGDYTIRLPIGEGENKWGAITVPKENLIDKTPHFAAVFFTTPEQEVRFRNGIMTLSSETVLERYYDAKREYRNFMQETLKLPRNYANSVRKRNPDDDFYIVKLPYRQSITCLDSQVRVPANGEISITVPDFYVSEDEITLGARGCAHSVILLSETDTYVKAICPNESIYNQCILEAERCREGEREQEEREDLELE